MRSIAIWLTDRIKTIILTVVRKHFGHVTFYAADVESGLIRSKLGKNVYIRYEKKIYRSYTEPAPGQCAQQQQQHSLYA